MKAECARIEWKKIDVKERSMQDRNECSRCDDADSKTMGIHTDFISIIDSGHRMSLYKLHSSQLDIETFSLDYDSKQW